MKIIDAPQALLDLLRSKSGEDDAWPEPETLGSPLLPVMKFDAAKLLLRIPANVTAHSGLS